METASLDAAFWISLVVVLVLLCFSAFFSGSETALTAASRGKLRAAADRGDKGGSPRARGQGRRRALHRGDPDGQQPRQYRGDLAGDGGADGDLRRERRRGGLAGDDRADPCVRRGAAEDLRDLQSRADRRPRGPDHRAADHRGSLATGHGGCASSYARRCVLWACAWPPRTTSLSVREEIAGALSLGHFGGIRWRRRTATGSWAPSTSVTGSWEEIMLHRSGIEMIDAALPSREIVTPACSKASTHAPAASYRDRPENIVGVLHAKGTACAP